MLTKCITLLYNPIKSIQREIQEETGFSANKWDELGTLVPAPGYADEEIYLL